jgi:hypothetical protein
MRPAAAALAAALVVALVAMPGADARADVAVPETGCRYAVTLAEPEARTLRIELACAGAGPHRLVGTRNIPNDHVRELRALDGGALEKRDGGWTLSARAGAAAARAAYTFDMDDLVASTNSASIGRRVGGSVVTSPGSFLLVPAAPGAPLRLVFAAPAGAAIATALARDGDDHLISTAELDPAGFMALGRIAPIAVAPAAPGAPASLTVAVLDAKLSLPRESLANFVRDQAAALARHYGGFPVARGLIVIRPVEDGRALVRGVVVGGGGASMLLLMGADATPNQLYGHWMLMHELVHFGHPVIAEGHRWLGEGMAVYTETVVRARNGWFGERETWAAFRRHMARAAPQLAGEGLARARSIDAVYWGGALLMLMADVEIRRETQGRRTLADCVKAVQAAGGVATERWALDRFVRVCDAGTGTGVFAALVARHVRQGTPFDLDDFWRRLGVVAGEDGATLDDAAPLAALRRAITAPTP